MLWRCTAQATGPADNRRRRPVTQPSGPPPRQRERGGPLVYVPAQEQARPPERIGVLAALGDGSGRRVDAGSF